MNNKYSSLVKRGVELDFQIKEMQKELDEIKETLRIDYARTGCKLYMAAGGEACATVTEKMKTTVDARLFYKELIENDWQDKLWDCITVNRTKGKSYVSADGMKRCSIPDGVTIAISFSAAK